MVLFIFFLSPGAVVGPASSGPLLGAFLSTLGAARGCTMRPALSRISGTLLAFTTLEAFHSAAKDNE